PGRRLNEWPKDGDNYTWNVKGHPANVHIMSLRDCSQETLNRNCHIVDVILTDRVRVPENSEFLMSRVFDLNTCLQYYRDWILDAESLLELDWYTNCAEHKALVINLAVNLPHNPESFDITFGADGPELWSAFLRRYNTSARVPFLSSDR